MHCVVLDVLCGRSQPVENHEHPFPVRAASFRYFAVQNSVFIFYKYSRNMVRSDYSPIITLVLWTSFPHYLLSFSLDLIESFPLAVTSVLGFQCGQVESGAVHGNQDRALFNYESPSPFMEPDRVNFLTLLFVVFPQRYAALPSVCALKLSGHVFSWV